MKHYTDIAENIKNLEIETVKNNKGVTYLNIESGFDIETSSTYVNNEKTAFMYIFMFGIGYGGPVYYGRTWDEFKELMSILKDELDLNVNRRLVIYVHNLGYEFQFMRKHLNWLDVFAVDERKPLKALCDLGIEFRDSYILSGFSLANLAKNLTKHKVKKMVGDLDYSLIRHSETELNAKELEYCENDIIIILAYINEQIDQYRDIIKIPLTNTGRVRDYVRKLCYYRKLDGSKANKGQYVRYRQIITDLTLNRETYIQLRNAFMGGFTHSNALYSGQVLENVASVDFTSSYPSVMISEKFPMSRFKEVIPSNMKHFREINHRYCTVFNARFIGLECKIEQETYLSESRCLNANNPVINNGRVVKADEITITLTNVDMDIIEQVYKWDKLEINDMKYSLPNYLPKPILTAVLKLYQDKTELKGVEGYEVEYLLSKGMLNSVYGMCVTDVVKDKSIYNNDEWSEELANIDDEISNYNESKNRFLFYAWGVWITAYSRRNLWTGIIAIKDDYVYSDTDSIKLLNYAKHENYFKWYNNQILDKMMDMCKENKFNPNLLKPKTIEGVEKLIGVWDFEGFYSRFKTLGAKRYIVEEKGRLEITTAGLSKRNGLEYMLEICKGDNTKVFEMFNDELYIPKERTGKNTHTYIDDEKSFLICDYTGVKSEVHSLSSVHLEPCDFTLSISKSYNEYLTNLQNGYQFRGVKNI